MAQGYRRIYRRANWLAPTINSFWFRADKPTDFYPSGVTAVAIASTLVCATWTDYTGVRWPVLVYMSVACIIASICILVWSSPTGLKFFAYCGW